MSLSKLLRRRKLPFAIIKLPRRPHTFYRGTLITTLACLIVFGLWDSLHETFSLWPVDADLVDLAMLYHGMSAHGLPFITAWRYTQDNWLLSLGPITFLVYALFGINHYTLVGPGWVMLVLNAMLGASILYGLSGGRKSLIPSLIFMLLSVLVGLRSLGNSGFMAFFMSHNSTMTYVLFALILAGKALKADRLPQYSSTALILTVFAASLSDPWFDAAFVLPAVLALALVAYASSANGKIYVLLTAIVTGSILAHTKLFGVLSFLPSTGFVFVHSFAQFIQNLQHYGSSLLTFFNGRHVFLFNVYAGLFYFGLSAFLFGAAMRYVLNQFYCLDDYRKFIILCAILSILTISAAFLMSNFPQKVGSGRFLDNIFYFFLLITLFSLSVLAQQSILIRLASLVWILVYCLTSIYTTRSDWGTEGLRFNVGRDHRLISFLKRHNLHYGFGGYHAADANAISVRSKWRVIIRPVSFEPVSNKAGLCQKFPFTYIAGNHPQSSPYWFRHKESTEHTKNIFLVLGVGGGNFELAHNSIACSEHVAIGQFGKPDAVYAVGRRLVLVWQKPLDVPAGAPAEVLIGQVSALKKAASCYLKKGGVLASLTPLAAEKAGCLDREYGGFTANAPNDNWTKEGGWLGTMDESVGVGVNVNNTAQATRVIVRFEHSAQSIYFPYPKVWAISRPPAASAQGQVVLVFGKRANLK